MDQKIIFRAVISGTSTMVWFDLQLVESVRGVNDGTCVVVMSSGDRFEINGNLKVVVDAMKTAGIAQDIGHG